MVPIKRQKKKKRKVMNSFKRLLWYIKRQKLDLEQNANLLNPGDLLDLLEPWFLTSIPEYSTQSFLEFDEEHLHKDYFKLGKKQCLCSTFTVVVSFCNSHFISHFQSVLVSTATMPLHLSVWVNPWANQSKRLLNMWTHRIGWQGHKLFLFYFSLNYY